MGVIAMPHPFQLLPTPTVNTKASLNTGTRASSSAGTRASPSTGTRASLRGGLVHVCLLGAERVDTVGLVRALSGLPASPVQGLGLRQGLDLEQGQGQGLGQELELDSRAKDPSLASQTVVHGSYPWRIAHEQGLSVGPSQELSQGSTQGLNQGSSQGLSQAVGHCRHHHQADQTLLTVVVTAVPLHLAHVWLAKNAQILDVAVLMVDDRLDDRNSNNSNSNNNSNSRVELTVDRTRILTQTTEPVQNGGNNCEMGNSSIETALQLERYLPPSLPRIFLMTTHNHNHNDHNDTGSVPDSSRVNRDRNVLGKRQESGVIGGIEKKVDGVELVYMGGRRCATLQDLQDHISHHLLPELKYVSTAIGTSPQRLISSPSFYIFPLN